MALPPVFVEFLASSKGVKAAVGEVEASLSEVDTTGAGSMKKTGLLGAAAIAGLGVAAVEVVKKTTEMSGDFQQQMLRVQTGAGEAAGSMKMVSAGILNMAGQVGDSTEELTSGLYTMESAGYHGQTALNMLTDAAEGAKVGNADLATVVDATTTAMNAYHLKGKTAAATTKNMNTVMNALIGTEERGKTNMEDLAGSLSTVLPAASAAHVSLNEVLGAMATMTSEGTPAADSATYLRQSILQLENPSGVAKKQLKALGLTAHDVQTSLGTKGLAATFTMLDTAIAKHHITGGQAVADMANMVGGTKGMQAALELTGKNMSVFKDNTAGVAQHVKDAGDKVEGWADVQKNFNQQMDQAKGSLESVGIQLGTVLMPYVQAGIKDFGQFAGWLAKNKGAAKDLAEVVGVLLAGAVLKATGNAFKPLISVMSGTVKGTRAVAAGVGNLAGGFRSSERAADDLSGPMGTLGGKLRSVAAGVGKLASSSWSGIRKGAGIAADGVSNLASSGWSSLKTGAGTVQDLAGAGWSRAASGAEQLAGGLKTAGTAALDFSRKQAAAALAAGRAALAYLAEKIQVLAQAAAARVAAAAQWLLDAAMDANPIALLVIAVAALIGGLVLAYTKVTWFRDMVNGAFKVVTQAAGKVVDFVKQHWPLLLEILTGPIGITVGLVRRYWSQISGAFRDGWHDVTSAGKAALAWIEGVPGKVKGYFGKASSWLVSEGRDVIRGLWTGISGMGSWLAGRVSALIKDTIPGPIRKVLDIASPSKVTKQLGAYVMDGLVQGLTGSAAQVKAASTRIANDLYEQLGDKDGKLQKLVASDGRKINQLAAQRATVATKLTAANKKLTTLQSDWTKEQSAVSGQIMQGMSIVTDLPDGASQLTAGDVVANMAAQAQSTKQFAAELKKLQKEGLSSTLVQQLASAGVSSGGATAQALASASAAQIKQINQLQSSTQSAANGVGSAVADSMYSAGIESAKGLVKGLKSQEAAIQKQMLAIAESMKTAIRKALGIHSPSTVMAELGGYTAQGMAVGLQAGTRHAVTAAAQMAQAVTRAAVPQIPRLAVPAGAGGAGGGLPTTAQVQVTVQVDRKTLFEAMQEATLAYARNNLTPGLSLARA